ncbi:MULTISPECIES: helix-turn-helix domain-containing protein [Protofrankia]|uniref:Helix-turn-helix domain protein n=1 Tax=Candidatus Protofrankia datiscae TaxID=2716812 RepID=F8B2Q0_9ACTN|nr:MULTISPECIES: helix-turn-helix transcriptional regulator [Protofrankia]AEH07770.1 helix-turn-helix domain protein [Candidatus Protofrankia datiscae]
MTALESGGGPTVRRILLGSLLRRLREEKGISREDAGYSIRGSESKISRLELGRVSFKERDVADLLTLYGVTDDAERAPLMELVREANTPGWWQNFTDVLPSWFQSYLGLEEAATLIRTYEVQFIPGLLQTEDYARAVMKLGNSGARPKDIERRISVRMNRQKLLARPSHPRLWVVIDEAALRRPLGGPAVMRAQLEHLIKLASQPNLSLQIMPFRFGGHAAEGGAFSILRFPEADLPDIVYIEQLAGAVYLDKREDVDRYMEAMDRLCVDSVPPAASIEALNKIINEL